MNASEYNILVRVRAAEARRQIAKLRAELAAINSQMARMGGASSAAASAGGVAAGGAAATAARANKATTAATAGQKAFTNETKSAADASDRAAEAHNRQLNRLRSLGATSTWSGKQISMFFTAPLLLAAGAAFKWQMENEKAATHLSKVYDGLTSDIEVMTESGPTFNGSPLDKFFTALSEKMGMAKADVIEAGAQWAQVGLKGSQLAQATQLTTEAMVLGDMDADKATEALVAIQAQYKLAFGNIVEEKKATDKALAEGLPAPRFETLTSALAQLNIIENQTGASMGDLITAFAGTAANARQAGVDVAHLGGYVAALVPSMGSAAKAAQGIKSILAKTMVPASERAAGAFEDIATKAGLAADAFMSDDFRNKGMGVGLESLADAYAQLSGAEKFDFAVNAYGIHQYARAMQLLDDISLRNGKTMEGTFTGMQQLGQEFAKSDDVRKRALAIQMVSGEVLALADNYQTMSDAEADAFVNANITEADIARGYNELEEAAKGAGEQLSYYGQALKGATDPVKSYATYQKELNTVLSSNPNAFKTVWVTIQNALTQAIIPLIPSLLYAARSVAKLMRAFGDMNPAAQKWVLIILAAVAAIGPLSIIFGSFLLLGSAVGKMFGGLGRVLQMVAFQFLGVGTAGYRAQQMVAGRTPLIQKVWNGIRAFLRLVGIGVTTDAVANEAARNQVAQIGATRRLAIEQGAAAATTAAATSGAAGQTAATAAGAAASNRVFAMGMGAMAGTAATGAAGVTGAIALGMAGTTAAIGMGAGASNKTWGKAMTVWAGTTATAATIIEGEVVSVMWEYAALTSSTTSAVNRVWAGHWTGMVAGTSAGVAAIAAELGALQLAISRTALSVSTTWVAGANGLVLGSAGPMLELTAMTQTTMTTITRSVATASIVIGGTWTAAMNGLIVPTGTAMYALNAGFSAGMLALTAAAETAGITIVTTFVASMNGAILAVRTFQAPLVAATASTMLAVTGAVQAGSTAQGRIFVATQLGHIEIINAARPGIVAAQNTTTAAQVAAINAGTTALVAAQRAQSLAVAGAATGGAAAAGAGAAAGGAAAAGAGAAGAGALALRNSGQVAEQSAKKSRGAIMTILSSLLMFIPGIFKKIGPMIANGAKSIGPKLLGGLKNIGPMLSRFLPKAVLTAISAIGGPITVAIAALAGILLVVFRKQIGEAFSKLGDYFKGLWNKIFGGDSNVPMLARPFVFALTVIRDALAALPGIVVGVFKAVVRVIQAAAKKVYEAFSYINPFAHHSPSLVENVTKGMDIVTDKFADADSSIQNSMRSSYAAINKFGQATSGLNLDVENRANEEKRTKIKQVDPGSLGAYDALIAKQKELENVAKGSTEALARQQSVIDALQSKMDAADAAIEQMNKSMEGLQKIADAAGEALQRANDKLDRYSNARIKGLRQAEDELFANEMAQKRLQLAIAQMAKEGEADVDSVADRFAKLQGAVENISGQRNELRMAGAGSDILGVYDAQIEALKSQQVAVEENMGPVEEMNKELERLQAQAEIMDLEKALAFDPLTRQLEQLKDTSEEMTFDQITAGIRSSRAEVDLYTAAVDMANLAIDGQQASIDAAQEARDAMNGQMDIETEKLDAIQQTYDQVDQALQAITESLDKYNQNIDTTIQRLEDEKRAAEEAAKALEDAANAGGAGGDLGAGASDFESISPGGTFGVDEALPDIDALTEQLVNDVNGSFEGISFIEPLKNAAKSVGNFFANLWTEYIWPGLQALPGLLLDFFIGLPGMFASAFFYIGGFLFGAFGRLAFEAVKGLANLAELVGTAIGDGIYAAIEWVFGGGMWDFFGQIGSWFEETFMKIFTSKDGFWSDIGGWIRDGFWGGIKNAFSNVWQWVWDNIVNPFIQGIKDGFGIASPSTVMMEIGGFLVDGLIGGLANLAGFLFDKFMQAFNWLLENIPVWIGRVIDFFVSLPGRIVDAVSAIREFLHDKFWEAFDYLTSGLPDWITNVLRFFIELPGKILGALGDAAGWLFDFGKNLVQGLLDGAGSLLSKIGEFFLDKVPGFIKEPFKKALGIESPSKVFKEYGENIGQGLTNGVTSQLGAVGGSVQSLADAATGVDLGTLDAPTLAPAQASVEVEAQSSAPTLMADEVVADTLAAKAAFDAFALTFDAAHEALIAELTADWTAYSAASTIMWQTSHTDTLTQQAGMHTAFNTATDTFVAANLVKMTKMKDDNIATTNAMVTEVLRLLDSLRSGGLDQFSQLNEGATNAFQTLSDNLNNILNDGITPMFDGLNEMLLAMEENFSRTVENVGKTWDGIKEKTATPARFVINDVYNDGIRGAWNQFNEFLDLPPLAEKIAKFATGGSVYGPGTGTSDSIPAMLSRGEHVVTAREVQGAGGHRAIEQVRAQWAAGQIPGFARGGPVDPKAPAWTGGGGESNLQPAAILARRNIKMYWPEIGSIGGYRAVDPYPDHPSGLALDVMTSNLSLGNQINDWLHREKNALALNYTIWQQMYQPAGGGRSLMEDRGSATQNHLDHIHALFNANGVPGIGVGGAGGGGADYVDMGQVITDAINSRMDAVRDRAPSIGGGIGQWIPKSIEKGREMLLSKMVPIAKTKTSASSEVGAIGNAESWRAMAMEAMRRNGFNADDPRQVDAMLRQIMSESSGNPRAVQQVLDVNSGGNEAKGLLQIARGTWPGVRDPSLVDDIFDPWANMNAALRYYKGKYGMDLTTMWGQGHGYDQGGVLQPGITKAINASGKPEAILTSEQWGAIYAAASNPLSEEELANAMYKATQEAFGLTPLENISSEIGTSVADAIKLTNDEWVPQYVESVNAQLEAAKSVAGSAGEVKKGVDRFTEVGTAIQTQVQNVSKLMLAVATAMQSETQNFAAWAPVIEAMAGLIEQLPDATPQYTAWSGFAVEMTDKMKQEQRAVDNSNMLKGIYQLFKDVAPSILKSTAKIGTAIEGLITTAMPIVTAAIAMAPVNPIGAALLIIPVILQAIFTLVPLIIEAILEIVPALIKALIKLLTKFMPNQVPAFGTIEEASRAVDERSAAIKDGSYLKDMGYDPQKSDQSNIIYPVNSNQTINIYGDLVMPNITNEDGAQTFVDNVNTLAGN